ncbi:Membrane protein OS=Streptomyces microflavus OX=1919 GN=Smic_07270 PE=4 SV=1 [Streptomyces microflavus]
MTHHSAMPLGVAPEHVVIAIGIPAAALALVAVGWLLGRRRSRPTRQRDSLAVTVSSIAAAGCTAYSGETSWAFATDYLGMNGVARAALFGVAELGLLALALIARQQLLNEGTPGLPGTLVWVVTGVMVVPAYAESGLVGGSVRAVFGPILAAVLWHFVMGIELRSRKPGAASQSMLATLGREVRERLLSRLGISARDRNAAQITRDRATSRAVELAARLAEYSPQQRQRWRGRRLARQLSKALGRAAVGTDSRQRDELLARLAARRHALTLVTTPLPSPWTSDREDTNAVAPRPEDALALSVRAPVPGPRTLLRGPGTGNGGPRPLRRGPSDGDRGLAARDRGRRTQVPVPGFGTRQQPGTEKSRSGHPRHQEPGTSTGGPCPRRRTGRGDRHGGHRQALRNGRSRGNQGERTGARRR